MKLELVVFDMAGTTVNDRDAVNDSLRSALRDVGVEVDAAAVNVVMGLHKPEAIRQLVANSDRATELLPQVDAIHTAFVEQMKHFYATDASVFAIPGAEESFALLRQAGIKVALNSGFSREIASVILERLGWREGEKLDATVTSDEVAKGRPHPDMIHHLMTRLAIGDTAHVAKIGDTPADLHEGANTGCVLNIGVTQGSHTRALLEPHPHTHLIATVADLPDLLHSLNVL